MNVNTEKNKTACIKRRNTFSSSDTTTMTNTTDRFTNLCWVRSPFGIYIHKHNKNNEHVSFTWQVVRKWPQLIQLEALVLLILTVDAHLGAAGICATECTVDRSSKRAREREREMGAREANRRMFQLCHWIDINVFLLCCIQWRTPLLYLHKIARVDHKFTKQNNGNFI